MAGKYSFNEGKYQNTFDTMYGAGAFNNGMAEAAALGQSQANVKFAEQLYLERLKAAEEAAAARSRASYSGGGRSRSGYSRSSSKGGSTGGSTSSSNKLVTQFKKEKAAAQKSPLETYNASQKKKMGVSVTKNVPVTPVAKNRSLSAYDKMKIVEADAAWVKKNR